MEREVCGKWMPKAQTTCARVPGHPGKCNTEAAISHHTDNRPRKTARRRGYVDPAGPARWRQAYRLKRYGLTPERFAQMLEAQGYACGMCHMPFAADEQIYIDHDHACCPVPPGAQTKCCGRCVRGLVCFRCNTALGYIELYGEMADAYLAAAEGRQRGVPRPSRDMGSTDRNPRANAGGLFAR